MVKHLRCRSALLVLVGLLACAPEATSPCYAPAAYTYDGTVREVARLPRGAFDALVLPDGDVLALTVEVPDGPLEDFAHALYRLDPATGEFAEVAAWAGGAGPMTRLADGRVLHVSTVGCSYTLIDLGEPGSVEPRTCALESFYPEIVLQQPDGQVLLFGNDHGGDESEGAVYTLDLADATLVKLDTRAEHGFVTPPSAPFALCDGRLMFPRTRLDGGDFFATAEAAHYYDPAAQQLSSVALPLAPELAAQLDATTALLIEPDNAGPGTAYLFDLETEQLTLVSPPDGPNWHDILGEQLIGLADGTALLVARDGGLHIFDREARSFTASALRFADAPNKLIRLPGGPVLAFAGDGRVERYE